MADYDEICRRNAELYRQRKAASDDDKRRRLEAAKAADPHFAALLGEIKRVFGGGRVRIMDDKP